MIIENANGKFYAPDTASVLDTKTGVYSLDSTKLVPYDLHLLNEELAAKKAEVSSLVISDADLLIWAKANNHDLQRKATLDTEITDIQTKINNFVI